MDISNFWAELGMLLPHMNYTDRMGVASKSEKWSFAEFIVLFASLKSILRHNRMIIP